MLEHFLVCMLDGDNDMSAVTMILDFMFDNVTLFCLGFLFDDNDNCCDYACKEEHPCQDGVVNILLVICTVLYNRNIYMKER